MSLDENHFGPVTQMNGPVEIRFVDEDQREGHEGKCREEARAQQQEPFGPHFTGVCRLDVALQRVAGRSDGRRTGRDERSSARG